MEGYVLGTGSRLDGRGSNGERAMEICEPRPQAFGISGGSQPWLSWDGQLGLFCCAPLFGVSKTLEIRVFCSYNCSVLRNPSKW